MAGKQFDLFSGVAAAGKIYILFIVFYALAVGALLSYMIAVGANAE